MIARKKSNLKATQDANEKRRLDLINEALIVILREKASYPDVTSLAKRVAAMVSLAEMTDPSVKRPGICFTTLLRNKSSNNPNSYRLQLEMFQTGTFDPANTMKLLSRKDLEDHIMKYPALRAYIVTKDLEITNLKNDLEENNRYMKRLQAHLKLQSQEVTQIPTGTQLKIDELQQARRDLTLTCTWIERLLRDMEWIEIDEESEIIIDKAKRGSPPVADRSLFAPFFKAIKIRRQGRGQDEYQ